MHLRSNVHGPRLQEEQNYFHKWTKIANINPYLNVLAFTFCCSWLTPPRGKKTFSKMGIENKYYFLFKCSCIYVLLLMAQASKKNKIISSDNHLRYKYTNMGH